MSAHIFAYSKREGTPAARMEGQVPSAVSSERVNKLYEVVEETAKKMLVTLNGTVADVIPENYKDGKAYGHTACFVEVEISCSAEDYERIQGKIVSVRLFADGIRVSGELQ